MSVVLALLSVMLLLRPAQCGDLDRPPSAEAIEGSGQVPPDRLHTVPHANSVEAVYPPASLDPEPLSQSSAVAFSADQSPASQTSDVLVSRREKKAAGFYQGYVDFKFYYPLNAKSPAIPSNAVLAMDRPLMRGGSAERAEYVALWAPRGERAYWGAVYRDESGQVAGTFIKNGLAQNLTADMTNLRMLVYKGTAEQNNFRFTWTLVRDADPATALYQKSGQCGSRVVPAVYRDGEYEFLGEADIDNRVFTFFYLGHVNVVDKTAFTNKVYLLTKQQCSCSCLA